MNHNPTPNTKIWETKEQKFCKETIKLVLEANNEHKKLELLKKEGSYTDKFFYVFNALTKGLYYNYWCYYFNEKEYELFKYMINIDSSAKVLIALDK